MASESLQFGVKTDSPAMMELLLLDPLEVIRLEPTKSTQTNSIIEAIKIGRKSGLFMDEKL